MSIWGLITGVSAKSLHFFDGKPKRKRFWWKILGKLDSETLRNWKNAAIN